MFLSLFVLLYLSKGSIAQSTPNDSTVQCEARWYQYGNKCFQVGGTGNNLAYWEVARQRCLDLGGDLASIHSAEENEFLSMYPVMNLKQGFWLGLNDIEKSGQHVWSDGSAVNYLNWDENEPTLKNGDVKENCVHNVFNVHNSWKMGKWNDLTCNRGLYYLCQKAINPSLSNPNPKYCSESEGGGYKLYSSCYHYVRTPLTWSEAEEYCQSSYDGHLMSFQDNTATMFLNYILKEMNVFSPLWIGIRATGGNKANKWTSGWLLLYEKWVEGFSQNRLKPGDCVVRLRSGSWDVRPCQRKFSFICEINSVKAPRLEPSMEGSYCPPEPPVWKDLGGDYCYYYNDRVDVTWHEANFECKRNGGTLASIHSDAEARSIELFIRYKSKIVFFIGLFRKYDDDWAWMDGSKVTYLAFDAGEPNNKDEKCTDLRAHKSRWNDIGCDAKRSYICSVKKIPPNVTVTEENAICSGELLIIE